MGVCDSFSEFEALCPTKRLSCKQWSSADLSPVKMRMKYYCISTGQMGLNKQKGKGKSPRNTGGTRLALER